jgi:hypothetical protein
MTKTPSHPESSNQASGRLGNSIVSSGPTAWPCMKSLRGAVPAENPQGAETGGFQGRQVAFEQKPDTDVIDAIVVVT